MPDLDKIQTAANERAMMLDAKRRYETGDLTAVDRQRLAQIRRDFQGWKGNGYVRT